MTVRQRCYSKGEFTHWVARFMNLKYVPKLKQTIAAKLWIIDIETGNFELANGTITTLKNSLITSQNPKPGSKNRSSSSPSLRLKVHKVDWKQDEFPKPWVLSAELLELTGQKYFDRP